MPVSTTTCSELLRDHGDRLLLYARSWCRCQADAEDVLQEAAMRMIAARTRAIDEPLAYLYRCVRSAALDRFKADGRRRQRERHVAERAPDVVEDRFAASIHGEERRDAIERALAELSPEQREVVTLRIWGEYPFARIAELTDSNVNTVTARYRYALGHLRDLLNSEELL